MLPDQIIIEPIITEKSVGAKALSRYTFKVNLKANRTEIAKAVEQLFKVKVTKVNTLKVRAKRRVLGRSIGRTSQWKKAYVTLEKGKKIEELEI